MEQLAPVAPYKKPRRPPPKKKTATEIVPGERPANEAMTAYSVPLDSYKIPDKWRKKTSEERKLILEHLSRLKHQSPQDFVAHCHHLLWSEELQMEEDIHMYDIPHTELEVMGPFLVLSVPGLAEKRPSVLRGDHVIAHRVVADTGRNGAPHGKVTHYQGFVHEVQLEKVKLKFDKSFHARHIPGHSYAIEFTFSRSVIRIGHQAVDIIANRMRPPTVGVFDTFAQVANDFFDAFVNPSGGQNISPMVAAVVDPTSPAVMSGLVAQQQRGVGVAAAPLQLYNRDLNEEQRRAVENIVCGGAGRAFPYLIYGPPGTGKVSVITAKP
jgi:helicase MOV-10